MNIVCNNIVNNLKLLLKIIIKTSMTDGCTPFSFQSCRRYGRTFSCFPLENTVFVPKNVGKLLLNIFRRISGTTGKHCRSNWETRETCWRHKNGRHSVTELRV